MKAKITTSAIKELMDGVYGKETELADTEVRGFQARLRDSGRVAFSLRYRNANGRRLQRPLGMFGTVTVEAARKAAISYAGDVVKGRDPQAEKKAAKANVGHRLDAVLDAFEIEYLGKKADGVNRFGKPKFSYKLKSGWQSTLSFDTYVRPKLGHVNVFALKRRDIARMLTDVASKTPVMADRALAHLRKALNWFATQEDDFNSPIVKGMSKTKGRARTRALDEQEIRDLWQALDECQAQDLLPHCYASFVRTLFLTATRLRMVSEVERDEIRGREWTIPDTRNKVGIPFLVYLTDDVLNLIKGRNSHPFLFSTNGGKTPINGFGKCKKILDAKLAEIRKREGRKPMAQWILHDFRRTARGLMKRGGVDPDTCERVLGHVIPGVRGVYDVEDYLPEKTHALKVLAEQVRRILAGRSAKVVEFKKRMAA